MRIGYSYVRFSSDPQKDGDSVRRQTQATAAWCEANNVRLDTSKTYIDKGKSAFRGKHRAKGVLRHFLDDVEARRIPGGSVLIIENLDRLSRENPWDAVALLCSIVNAGITVVTLSPSVMTYQHNRELAPLMLAVAEFTRAHSESASKADRLTAMWTEKKRQAREEGGLVTRRLPAWIAGPPGLRVKNRLLPRDGNLRLIPERVAVVKRIFDLAAHQGYGIFAIVGLLTAEGVANFDGCRNKGKTWSKAYVRKLLTGRTVLGEYQPLKDGQPDGPPLADYYPAIIDEATWHQAQAAIARRKQHPGRTGEKVASLFTGLLWDATTGGRMLIAWQNRGPKGKRVRKQVLVNARSMEGGAESVSFPYDVFENAVLDRLHEIDPADILRTPPAGEAAELAAQLAVQEQRLRQLQANLTDGDKDVPALMQAVREQNSRVKDTARRLAVARQKESHPLSAAWGELKTRLSLAADAVHRLRIRDLLRTIVEDIRVLIVPCQLQRRPTPPRPAERCNGTRKPRPRGSHRWVWVQMTFAEAATRHFVIHHQAAGHGRPGGWACGTLRWKKDADLRDPEHVAQLTRFLLARDPATEIPLEPNP
jgi:DNA invertase Pin-like site-specific DNA recombinase